MKFEEELIAELKEMNRNLREIEERLDTLNGVIGDCYTKMKKL